MYTDKQINDLKRGFATFMRTSERWHMKFSEFAYRLKDNRAKEFMSHGFLRRFGTLKRCIENIYKLNPPEQIDKLEWDVREDLEINLQAFVFNVFGALDNLALVMVHELGIKIRPERVGFLKEKIDETLLNALSTSFRKYITSKRLSNWKYNMRDFRHALGHRIPLYVPPAGLNGADFKRYNEIENKLAKALQRFDVNSYQKLMKKQASLGRNLPIMTHSLSEGSKQVFFHPQVLADFNTVVEITTKFIDEFDAFDRKANGASSNGPGIAK